MLTIESAASYARAKLAGSGVTISNGREYDLGGIAVVAFDLTDRDGEACGTFDIWIEAGRLYGEW